LLPTSLALLSSSSSSSSTGEHASGIGCPPGRFGGRGPGFSAVGLGSGSLGLPWGIEMLLRSSSSRGQQMEIKEHQVEAHSNQMPSQPTAECQGHKTRLGARDSHVALRCRELQSTEHLQWLPLPLPVPCFR
jgi:hypothetical protein